MPREQKPWFRVYLETFSDKKLRKLGVPQKWLWIAMLGASRESPEPGRLLITTGYPMTARDLAAYADVRLNVVTTALPIMERLGMIAMDGDTITIPNWDARQFESDNVTARTQKHREKTKERSNNVPTEDVGTLQTRSREQRRNAPDTDTDTDNSSLRSELGAQPARTTRTNRGTRLPPNFQPNPEAITQMRDECPGVDLQSETRKFTDYWTAESGQRATKINWQSTWKNWIRGTYERTPTNPNGQLKSKRQQERDAMFDRQLARARERDAANEPRTNSETSAPNRSLLPGTEPR